MRITLGNSWLGHKEQHIDILGKLHKALEAKISKSNFKVFDEFDITIDNKEYKFVFSGYAGDGAVTIVTALDDRKTLGDLI